MSSNNITLVFSLLIGVAILSCNKDKVEPTPHVPEVQEEENCDGCEPIPLLEGYNTGYNHIKDTIIQRGGEFNPNNDNEIAYIEYAASNGVNKRLIIYNLVTKQKNIIYEGQIMGAPAWSKKGWILINLMDFQIWKIKPNGDSLAQITSNGSWFHPEVNKLGDKFIAYRGYAPTQFSVIMDLNGNHLDTIPTYLQGGDWKHDSFLYANFISNKLRIFNMNSLGVIAEQTVADVNSEIQDFCWISDNEGIVTNIHGVYRINPFTGSMNKLFCTCNSRFYLWSSTNSDKSKIMFTKIELTLAANNTLIEDETLLIMNPDGSGQEILDLD